MRSGALTHPVDLTDRDVQTEEELRDFLGERSGPTEEGVAVVQTQGRPDLREHEGLGHAVVHGDVSLPGNGIIKDSQLQMTELLRDPSPPLQDTMPTPASAWC